MRYDVADIVKDVRIVLDETAMADPAVATLTAETLDIDTITRSMLENTARLVLDSASMTLLDGGVTFPDTTIQWKSRKGYGAGYIMLPKDFLRLLTFQMSDWDYAVDIAIDQNNPSYQMQHSRYPGLKGSPQKPVVAIVHQPTGLQLQFFSCYCGEKASIKVARYIPLPKVVDDGIELPEKLYDAVVYRTAFDVSQVRGMGEAAMWILQKANLLMGVTDGEK